MEARGIGRAERSFCMLLLPSSCHGSYGLWIGLLVLCFFCSSYRTEDEVQDKLEEEEAEEN